MQYYSINPTEKLKTETPYSFYGNPIHKSRVLQVKGKEAPSLIRPHMRGWGMTEVERVIRSFNMYVKNHNVIFELLDEAKIDVFGIQGFNESLIDKDGTTAVTNRVQTANMIKNTINALTMDTEDSYEQKQMNFAGLGEMLTQIRQGIASDLKMPMTKLFGVSSAGFNSGEDDIENYNAMVESEIRAKSKGIIIEVLRIVCAKVLGFVPDDLTVEFESLRVLSAEKEQNVKTAKFGRVIQAWQAGIMTTEEAKEAINKDNLTGVKLDVTDDIYQDRPQQIGDASAETKKLGTQGKNAPEAG